jgi:hypothetical protein
LAYDFNLDVSDTLVSCLGGLDDNHIHSFDSILVDNQYRKALWISGGGYDHYIAIIEGIGTLAGAFEPIVYNEDENGNHFFCMWKDNQIALSFLEGNACGLISIHESPCSENHVSIIPNPFSLTAEIQSNENLINATLVLYNSFGQQVKILKNISGQTIILERGNLSVGIYYLQLFQGNRIIKTEKIIIAD